jgi:hypothetical protein
MAATVEELEAAKAREEEKARLLKVRNEAAARLAAAEAKLAQAENVDFIERLGRMQISEMTAREKSEIVSRLGLEGFEKLLGVR